MLVQRSAPPVLPTYGSYKQYLRFDFYYACAYCSTSEVEAGAIGFEIDHYKPRVEGGSDDYENLMWSCEHCNGGASKGDWWPTADQQAQGIRLLRPDFDNLAEHYDLDGTELKSKSVTAETSITMLRLNRETLRRLRSFRDRLYRAKGATMLGLQALQQISLDHLKPELALKLIEDADQRGGTERGIGRLHDSSIQSFTNARS